MRRRPVDDRLPARLLGPAESSGGRPPTHPRTRGAPQRLKSRPVLRGNQSGSASAQVASAQLRPLNLRRSDDDGPESAARPPVICPPASEAGAAGLRGFEGPRPAKLRRSAHRQASARPQEARPVQRGEHWSSGTRTLRHNRWPPDLTSAGRGANHAGEGNWMAQVISAESSPPCRARRRRHARIRLTPPPPPTSFRCRARAAAGIA